MPRRLPDLPKDDGSGRLMPWLVGIMIYLAALSLGTILTLDGAIQRWNAGLEGTLTVQLPRPADGSPLPRATINAAVKRIADTHGVLSATALDDKSITRLLQPWLSGGVAADTLPLPVLIDVHVKSGDDINEAHLGHDLEKIVPGASVAEHGQWAGSLFRVARMIEITGFMVLGLMGAATVLTVIFTIRTSLLIHKEVIDILHMIGARDSYIAARFQWQAFRLAFGGGIVGTLLAGLTIGALVVASSGWHAGEWGFSPEWRSVQVTLFLIVSLPVCAGLVGIVTARLTVMRTLARTP